MGWSTSIHIRTSAADEVVQRLTELREHECLVGHSGVGWVGVYSKSCETSCGELTPNLTSRLSAFFESYSFGVCLHEDEFSFWFYQRGTLLDIHPQNRRRRVPFEARQILKLVSSVEKKQQIETALSRKTRRPAEILGMTEQDFIAQAYEDMARLQSMSPEEKEKFGQQAR